MSNAGVLLLEDHEGHRQTLFRHVTRTGWPVSAAETGKQGLDVMSEVDPPGTELIARLIHAHSPSANDAFVAVNCMAVLVAATHRPVEQLIWSGMP